MRLDPDDLAASSLRRAGDPALRPTDPDDLRLLEDFERLVSAGRSLGPDDVAAFDDEPGPPTELWDRIAATVASDAHSEGARPNDRPLDRQGPDGPTVDVADATGGAEVVDLDARRRNRRLLAAVAAVAVVLAGLTGLAIGTSGNGATELASAQLGLLAGDGAGEARLVQRGGELHLVVDVEGLSPAERADFFEVWVLTPEGTDPQSIHKFPVGESDAVIDIELPPGVDTSQFPVVDISEEVDDGDDSHSGKSILRGTLRT
jgi:hypothetical protein